MTELTFNNSRIFSKEPLNTGRQPELDILKGCAIIFMIIEHCMMDLLNYWQFSVCNYAAEYLSQLFNASVFMMAMGITVAYSQKRTPRFLASRGFSLLLFGRLLQAIRTAIPDVIGYLVTKNVYFLNDLTLCFSVDIMEFAGLAFLLLALLKQLRLNGFGIALTGIVMSIVGCCLDGLNTGIYFVDQLLGFFYATDSESFFPLFNWFIFPAFGVLLGEFYVHIREKTVFFRRVIMICLPIAAVYFVLRFTVDFPFLYDLKDEISVIRMNILDAVFFIIFDMVLLGTAYMLYLANKRKVPLLIKCVSENINMFYCISWVVILFVNLALLLITGDYINNFAVGCAVSVGVILLTYLLVYVYKRFCSKHPKAINKKIVTSVIVTILVFNVICAVYAFSFAPTPSNYLNDYSSDLLPLK